MDFNDTPEENDFRLEVRDWLKNNAPKEKKAGGYDSIDVQESALARARDWQAKKAEAGYAAITWPSNGSITSFSFFCLPISSSC